MNLGNRLRLLTRFVETTLRIHRRDLAVAFEDVDDRPFAAVVRLVFLSEGAAHQRVRTNGHFVAVAHLAFRLFIEGGAQDSDDHHRYAEMDDVAAVPPRVAVPKVQHRAEQTLPALASND